MVRTPRIRPLFFALVLLLLPSISGAADNWIEVRSPHFTVATNSGEKDARKIADQFEQIRGLFQRVFTTLRVDAGQPILILAAKNENTLKEFLPEYWEVKGRVHLAGLYQPGQDKDYVVMRLNSEGDNPYHTLYHEYTHALLRLNYHDLPVWLNEGLAEFFGNTTLGDKEITMATFGPGQLYVLNQNKLLPIETLFQVDQGSPYYNEQDRASVFYAQSWAVVHYFLMDPEARQKQYLKRFLSAFDKSGNQLEAARETLGDLKEFGRRIDAYARRSSLNVSVLKNSAESTGKNYPVRNLSPGEVLALRGDFFAHHNRLERAKPVLEEAVKLEPNLAFAHESLGYYHYRLREVKEADKEMQEALRLGAMDFIAPYYHGLFLFQSDFGNADAVKEATDSLLKATQLNPRFAPAYDALANAYSRFPETRNQALEAAAKAAQLDPATLWYTAHLIQLLLNSNQVELARPIAERLARAARSPEDQRMAQDLLRRVKERED
jgi:tetratricopeptide (TPR) repeat protein